MKSSIAYQQRAEVRLGKSEVAHRGPRLQPLGDPLAWPLRVAELARIYHSLPEGEKARTGVFASNYGGAGAINLIGSAHGLPSAIGARQTHWRWAPPLQEPELLSSLQLS